MSRQVLLCLMAPDYVLNSKAEVKYTLLVARKGTNICLFQVLSWALYVHYFCTQKIYITPSFYRQGHQRTEFKVIYPELSEQEKSQVKI